MDKENVAHICSGIQNKEILLFVTIWMDTEGIILGELNQAEKDKYCVISLGCRIFKKPNSDCKVEVARNSGKGESSSC